MVWVGLAAGGQALGDPATAHATQPPGSSPDLRQLVEGFDDFAAPLIAAEQLSGQLLVAHGDEIALERFYGWANRELRSPVTAETCFNIASITKPMTQVLALQLLAEGKLAADDPVAKWIPGFPGGEAMTVTHLLQHRAGIPHRFTTDEQETVPHTAAEMVELAKLATLEFTPGERSQYSSGNYIVLARILELASGRSYSELLHDRITGPLGLRHTVHADSRQLLAGRAASYVPALHGMENAPLKDNSFLVGAGSVCSTARDLHRLLRAVAQGTLSSDIRANLLRNGILRWNGSTNGFRAFAEYDSATSIAVIFVGNYHTGAVDCLSGGVRALLAGQTPPPPTVPPLTAATISEAALRRLEGVYQVASNPRLELRARDGALYMNDWLMLPTSETTFVSPRDYAVVTAVFALDGSVERLDWQIGAQTYPCPRVGDLPAAGPPTR